MDFIDYMKTVQPRTLSRLEEAAKRGDLVPFVGAGMSHPFGYPLWDQLLLDMAKEMSPPDALVKEIDYRLHPNDETLLEWEKAAESARLEKFVDPHWENGYLPSAMPRDKNKTVITDYEGAADRLYKLRPNLFNTTIASVFGTTSRFVSTKVNPDAPIYSLPALSILAITTNFDGVLEHAYQRHFGSSALSTSIRPVLKADLQRLAKSIDNNEPTVLKVHGDYGSDEGRILTLDEFRKGYGRKAPQEIDFRSPVPNVLSSVATAKHFFFMGCSLNNDSLCQFLKQWVQKSKTSKHFAFALSKSIAEGTSRRNDLDALGIDAVLVPTYMTPEGYQADVDSSISSLLKHLIACIPDNNSGSRPLPPTTLTEIVPKRCDRETELRRLNDVAHSDIRVGVAIVRSQIDDNIDSLYFRFALDPGDKRNGIEGGQLCNRWQDASAKMHAASVYDPSKIAIQPIYTGGPESWSEHVLDELRVIVEQQIGFPIMRERRGNVAHQIRAIGEAITGTPGIFVLRRFLSLLNWTNDRDREIDMLINHFQALSDVINNNESLVLCILHIIDRRRLRDPSRHCLNKYKNMQFPYEPHFEVAVIDDFKKVERQDIEAWCMRHNIMALYDTLWTELKCISIKLPMQIVEPILERYSSYIH